MVDLTRDSIVVPLDQVQDASRSLLRVDVLCKTRLGQMAGLTCVTNAKGAIGLPGVLPIAALPVVANGL